MGKQLRRELLEGFSLRRVREPCQSQDKGVLVNLAPNPSCSPRCLQWLGGGVSGVGGVCDVVVAVFCWYLSVFVSVCQWLLVFVLLCLLGLIGVYWFVVRRVVCRNDHQPSLCNCLIG